MDRMPKDDGELGEDAAQCGLGIEDCPYDPVSQHDRWLAWRRGWLRNEVMLEAAAVGIDEPLVCPDEDFLASKMAPVELPPVPGRIRTPKAPPDPMGGYSGPGMPPKPNPNPFKRDQERPWRDDRNDAWPKDGWDGESEDWNPNRGKK